MTVDDVFGITGRGTVVTGIVTVGEVRTGDAVWVSTSSGDRAAVVTGIEVGRTVVDFAISGQSVGLRLDIEAGDLARGSTVRSR